MNQIEIDVENRTAWVGAGVINLDLSKEAEPFGLILRPRSLIAVGVHHRRQCRQQLGWGPLSGRGRHHQPCPRPRGGPGRWRDPRPRRSGPRHAGPGPEGVAGRLRGHARCRDPGPGPPPAHRSRRENPPSRLRGARRGDADRIRGHRFRAGAGRVGDHGSEDDDSRGELAQSGPSLRLRRDPPRRGRGGARGGGGGSGTDLTHRSRQRGT